MVVLIISVLVLASQRKAIDGLIGRIKSLKYPGGEVQTHVSEAEAGNISTLVETLSRNMSERAEMVEATDRPSADAAIIEPTQNREPVVQYDPLPTETVDNLVMLGAKAANLLSELAVPPPVGGFGPPSETIDILRNRGVLDSAQARALRDTFEIADRAASGAAVPQRVTVACENSGAAILEQLALLRTVAAVRFEDYVLSRLCSEIPTSWSAEIDAAILPGKLGLTIPGASSSTKPVARVDALVRKGDKSAILEIRARLQPNSPGQIEALRGWLAALPPHLPVLLVVLGEGLTTHQLNQLRAYHDGQLEILHWDRDSESVIAILGGLLDTSEVLPQAD